MKSLPIVKFRLQHSVLAPPEGEYVLDTMTPGLQEWAKAQAEMYTPIVCAAEVPYLRALDAADAVAEWTDEEKQAEWLRQDGPALYAASLPFRGVLRRLLLLAEGKVQFAMGNYITQGEWNWVLEALPKEHNV